MLYSVGKCELLCTQYTKDTLHTLEVTFNCFQPVIQRYVPPT